MSNGGSGVKRASPGPGGFALPLRGRWLRYFLVGLALTALQLAGLGYIGGYRFRAYQALDGTRPYSWNPAPSQGFGCQQRMMFTGSGEVARYLRVGLVVIEVAHDWGWSSGKTALDGPDCH